MSAKQAKRIKLSTNNDELDHSCDIDTKDDKELLSDNNVASRDSDLEYSVLRIQVILDNIMRYLTYKEVRRLSLCCRTLRELTAFEFDRRKHGSASNFTICQLKNLASEPYLRHSSGEAMADIQMGTEAIQRRLTEAIDQLHFRPKIAFLFSGVQKSKEHEMWSKWYKGRLPSDCTILNVLSKAAICGSIGEHVYEVNRWEKTGNCGLTHLLLGAQCPSHNVQIFKSLKELVSLTDNGGMSDGPVKCILYFTRSRSRAKLPKILSVCKERNGDRSIAFGGLIVDSLASFVTDSYTSKIECAGLVFSGSNAEVSAASAIIEDLSNDEIRASMIRFRDSIPFDIGDARKNTICFLLSCIEHTPSLDQTPEYTASEMDIFHTIFPRNVKVFGISGHGEFGQVSGVMDDGQKYITYQYSCVMVLVQFPIK